MCDSYTPSSSVSVRWMVAPGYCASTACSTLVLVSPVSSCSLPWCGWDGASPRLVGGWGGALPRAGGGVGGPGVGGRGVGRVRGQRAGQDPAGHHARGDQARATGPLLPSRSAHRSSSCAHVVVGGSGDGGRPG